MYTVIVEDLSHLGGPMGSEYTAVIERKYFSTENAAIKFIKEDAPKRSGWKLKIDKPHVTYDNKRVWDLGNIGYTLDKIKAEE